MRRFLTAAVLAGAVLAASAPKAHAAYEFYVSIKGDKQGQFKGEGSRAKGQQGWIPAIGFSFEVRSPRDAATGQASGKRTYLPITITKEWGAASPQVFQALVTNEVLPSVVLEFMRTNPNGEEEVYHRIRLTGAVISSIKQYAGSQVSGADAAKHSAATDTHELEDVSFTFQRIEIENVPGKTTAQDSFGGRDVGDVTAKEVTIPR